MFYGSLPPFDFTTIPPWLFPKTTILALTIRLRLFTSKAYLTTADFVTDGVCIYFPFYVPVF